MPETFLNKAQLTGLSAEARRTEILRAKDIAARSTATVINGPSRSGDDTSVIQAALDSDASVVLLKPGVYRADGLVVPTNTTLGTASQGHGIADFGSATTIIRARDGATSDYVVSFSNGTSPRHESQVLTGLAISGNQVCGGVYTEGWYGIVRDVHISETSGPSLNVQSQSIIVEGCLTTGPFWPDVDPGAATGGVIIGGADSFFLNCEFSASNVTGFNYRGNTVAAVYVTGGYHSFVGCIAEYGDYGWHLTGAALFNKFTTCRADRNLGHGWYNQGSYGMFSSCSSSDSNTEDDGYSQFYTTGEYNRYSACESWNALAGADAEYGFYDSVAKGATASDYAACVAPNGWATAEFGGTGAHEVPWTGVTFANSWVNDGTANLSNVEYQRIGDMVTLRGIMKNGTLDAKFADLPADCRPPDAVGTAASAAGTHGSVVVYGTGECWFFGGTNTQVIFSISFSVV